MLKKFLVIISLFGLAYSNTNHKQQIEIILFKNNSINIESDNTLKPISNSAKYKMHSYYEPEYYSLITKELDIGQTIANITYTKINPNNVDLLPENKKQLNAIKNRIRAQTNNEILLHIAWQEPFDNKSEKKYMLDGEALDKEIDINPSYDRIYGEITTSNNNNLDIKIDLALEKDNEKQNFFAKRRLKQGQINYIDNNNYGMLILLQNI